MYKILSFFTLLIGTLLGTLLYSNNPLVSDTVAFLPCIIVSFVFILFSAQEEFDVIVSRRIYIAYILRFLIMLWNVYGREIYCLPGVGTDTEGFYRIGAMIGQDLSLLNQNLYGAYYTKYLGIIYSFTGPSYLLGSYLNFLYSIIAISILQKILLKINGLNDHSRSFCILVFAFEPIGMIIGSSLRRESLMILFVVLSMYYIVRWINTKELINWFIAIGCILISSVLHAGVIGISIGYLVLVLFYDIRSNCWKFQDRSIVMGVVVFLGIVVLMTRFRTLFLNKLLFEDESAFLRGANRARGGAAYLTNINVNSLSSVVFYSPLKLIYFLTSPVPWNWRNISDIIAFFMDASVYLILFPVWIKSMTYARKDPIVFSFGLSCLIGTIIYATGSQNSANAMRHRLKLLSVMIVVVCLIKAYKNNKLNNPEDDIQLID